MKELLFFYGLECQHCLSSEKFVDQLINEGFDIKKMEVWHNKKNAKKLEELDNGEESCGGIPFFINQKNNKTLCGEVNYEEIKEWAK